MKIIKAQKGGKGIILFCENFYDEFTNGVCANIEIFSKRWDLQFSKESIMNRVEIIKIDYHNLFLQFYHLMNSLLLKSIRAYKKTKKLLWELSPSRHEIDMEEIKG